MGKSETAKMFARLGLPVYDADAAVHQLYEPGGAAVAPIAQQFPAAVPDGAGRGKVDRALLAKELARSETGFKILETIVHPLVARAQLDFLDQARAQGAAMVVLDIPLLFETGGDQRVDVVVVVSAPPEIQRQRVLQREGMTPEKLEQILARQTADAEKRSKADFVVETGHGLDHAFAQVQEIVTQLRQRLHIS